MLTPEVIEVSLSSFSFSGITLIHQGFIFLMKWIKEEKEKYAWKQWSIQANIKIKKKREDTSDPREWMKKETIDKKPGERRER